MIPGINPRDLQKAMKRMGMKQEEIDAEEVIIRCRDKDIVIRNPEVMKVNMMGQESLQISGRMEDVEKERQLSEEDIRLVMEQASVEKEDAEKALTESKGDIAEAILSLKKE